MLSCPRHYRFPVAAGASFFSGVMHFGELFIARMLCIFREYRHILLWHAGRTNTSLVFCSVPSYNDGILVRLAARSHSFSLEKSGTHDTHRETHSAYAMQYIGLRNQTHSQTHVWWWLSVVHDVIHKTIVMGLAVCQFFFSCSSLLLSSAQDARDQLRTLDGTVVDMWRKDVRLLVDMQERGCQITLRYDRGQAASCIAWEHNMTSSMWHFTRSSTNIMVLANGAFIWYEKRSNKHICANVHAEYYYILYTMFCSLIHITRSTPRPQPPHMYSIVYLTMRSKQNILLSLMVQLVNWLHPHHDN